MRTLIVLLVLISTCGCNSSPITQAAPSTKTAVNLGCQISQVADGPLPDWELRAKVHLETSPTENLERAYFSMGCFWGAEAMLASHPGVIKTQVGYTGGTLANPSYSAIGDHVETVEVTYDSRVTNYEQLLRHFWSHHNASAKPIFRQYASGIFATKPEHLVVAKRLREELSTDTDQLLTAILPAETFYPAEESHQKYYLQQDKNLFKSLPYGTSLKSELATKLNAIAARTGDKSQWTRKLEDFGIGPIQAEALFERAGW